MTWPTPGSRPPDGPQAAAIALTMGYRLSCLTWRKDVVGPRAGPRNKGPKSSRIAWRSPDKLRGTSWLAPG